MEPVKLILIFILCFLGLATSCSLSSRSKKSFLVILVDDLGSADLNCSREPRDNVHSGLSLLCPEAIRFSHAFTTSVLSNPAIASVLSAQYPISHGLHNNGADYLKPETQSLAELAQKSGYKTAFFSGGAPVFRRSGLHAGFDLFDDNIDVSIKLLFRPLSETKNRLFQWLNENSSEPFLAFVYAPDLAFTHRETTNDFGEVRNLSYESQLEELDENLFSLFQELKKKNMWEDLWIVVAGLNGSAQIQRPRESKFSSVLNDRSQVGLLIKTPQRIKNQANSRSIDENVTLADLGSTLFDLVSGSVPKNPISELPIQSFKSVLQDPAASLGPDERFVIIESAWPLWKNLGTTRYSLRKTHLSYMNDSDPKIYNSLIDHIETTPIPIQDMSISSFAKEAQNLAHKLNLKKYSVFAKDDKKLAKNESCLKIIERSAWSAQDRRDCDDPLLWELIDWTLKDQENAKRKFLRSYYYYNLDLEIKRTNQRISEPWDVVDQKELSPTDIYLSKPNLSKFKAAAQRSLSQTPVTTE